MIIAVIIIVLSDLSIQLGYMQVRPELIPSSH